LNPAEHLWEYIRENDIRNQIFDTLDEVMDTAETSLRHLHEAPEELRSMKGAAGDAINAVLAVAAMNFQKLLGAFWRFFLCRLLSFCCEVPFLQSLEFLQMQSQNA
jgi:hypothetical protein